MKFLKKNRAILLALIVFMVCFPKVRQVEAKTTQELLDEAKDNNDKTKEELEETQDQIDDLNHEINSLKKKLQQLDDEMAEICDNIEDLEEQIAVKEAQIEITRENLAEAIADRDLQYQNMVARIQFIYERGETVYLEVLFEAKNFSDLLTRADYIQKLEDYDQKMLTHYKEVCTEIENMEQDLLNETSELEDLKAEELAEQNRVADIIAETSNYVVIYKDQVEDAERLALEYEEKIRKQEEDIKTLEKKLEEEKRLAALAAASQTRDLSSVTFAEGDRYLLAHLILCEAGGESYAGKLAVGAVVINRMLNGAFPDTIVGVIYQRNQFSPVGSGRLALYLSQNRATASCYKAADEAMSGVTNVAGCLFFRTPTPKVTPVYTIGGHVFY